MMVKLACHERFLSLHDINIPTVCACAYRICTHFCSWRFLHVPLHVALQAVAVHVMGMTSTGHSMTDGTTAAAPQPACLASAASKPDTPA